jgi:hypothetical protein
MKLYCRILRVGAHGRLVDAWFHLHMVGAHTYVQATCKPHSLVIAKGAKILAVTLYSLQAVPFPLGPSDALHYIATP